MKIKRILLLSILLIAAFALESLAQDSPRKVYIKYLFAVRDAGELNDLRPYISSDPQNLKNFDELLKNKKGAAHTFRSIKYNSINPDRIKEYKETVNGDSAYITIKGMSGRGLSTVRAHMRKEGTRWALIWEKWDVPKAGHGSKSKKNDLNEQLKSLVEKMNVPPSVIKKIPNLKKYFSVIFIGLILLITLISLLIKQKRIKDLRKMLSAFAMKYGYEYSKEDVYKLGDLIAGSNLAKEQHVKSLKTYNILSKSDTDSKFYFFNYTTGLSKQKIYFTACLFDLNKDFHCRIYMRKRLPSIVEKLVSSAMKNKQNNLDPAKIAFEEDFNRYYIIYSDDETAVSKIFNQDLIYFLKSHKKRFKNAASSVHLSGNILMVHTQGRGFTSSIMNESDLDSFIKFSKELKDRIMRVF